MRKLDHLWFFEEINGDEPAEYKNFKKWQKNYFASFVKGLQKVRCQLWHSAQPSCQPLTRHCRPPVARCCR